MLRESLSSDFGSRLSAGAATGIATIGLGMAIGAAGMLPRFAVNAETNLAGGDYSGLGDAGVLNPPWQLDYLLLQTLGTGSGYHFRAAAFGAAAVILALLALPMARQRFAAPFFAILTLVAMILTLDTTPLHQLFYLIPRFREFHDHDAWRSISLAAIGPAMLSGAAIEALAGWRGRPRLLPLVAAPLVLYLAAAFVLWRATAFIGWLPVVAATLTTLLIAVAVATPASLPAVTMPARFARAAPTLILAVVLVFPTGLELAGSWLNLPRDGAPWRHLARDPAVAAAVDVEISHIDPGGAGQFLQEQLAASGPFRYAGYGGILYPGDEARQESYMGRRLDPAVQAFLVNGRPIFLGLYDMQGYNPLQLSRYVDFITALNGETQDYHTAFLLPAGVRSPLLDLLDVRYVLIDATLPPERDDVLALTEGRREVFRTPRVIVYERTPNPPHAWIVHDVRMVSPGEALPLLASGTVDPYRIALVEETPPETQLPADPAADSARVVEYQPDKHVITTRSTTAGFLVISEIYSPGWRAYVDGEESPLMATNHALQGVALPPGEHTVELIYDPISLRVGIAISGIALAAMLFTFAIAGWSSVRRRWQPTAPTLGQEPFIPPPTPGRVPGPSREARGA